MFLLCNTCSTARSHTTHSSAQDSTLRLPMLHLKNEMKVLYVFTSIVITEVLMAVKSTYSSVVTCSRGLKIIPDVVFDPTNPKLFGPVRLLNSFFLDLRAEDIRTNTIYWWSLED